MTSNSILRQFKGKDIFKRIGPTSFFQDVAIELDTLKEFNYFESYSAFIHWLKAWLAFSINKSLSRGVMEILNPDFLAISTQVLVNLVAKLMPRKNLFVIAIDSIFSKPTFTEKGPPSTIRRWFSNTW